MKSRRVQPVIQLQDVHHPRFARAANRTVQMFDGRIVEPSVWAAAQLWGQ